MAAAHRQLEVHVYICTGNRRNRRKQQTERRGMKKMNKVSIRESFAWKILYHENETDAYWLLCKVEYIGLHKYYKILAKINYIDDSGKLVLKEEKS